MSQPRSSQPQSSQKDWARSQLRGAEPILSPSFTPDFAALDEEAIRLDVANSIEHGFFSCYASRAGLDLDESTRMLEVMLDEADGRILVSGTTTGASAEDDVAFAQRCAELGCSYIFVSNPRTRDASESDLVAWYRSVIEATELPVMLYASLDPRHPDRGPSGIALDVFDSLADVANVVAIKLTQPMSAATAFVVCERLADRLLVGPVNLDLFPLLAKHYGAQFTGPWNVEAVQSPSHPFVVDFVEACADGDFERAMRVHDAMEPALRAFFDFQAPIIARGSHPIAHMKYFQWCTGGNGGLPRDVHAGVPVLTPESRSAILTSYGSVGIEVDDDGSFLPGRAAHARGVRDDRVAPNSLYEPGLVAQPIG
ncbi:MAG TPA: dihydrodipicolinate synthase family protein [Acidimicrobiia bacterium]|nr:dihydrodipicolinate synthase family protein [Acidimicrobiia bacterium]